MKIIITNEEFIDIKKTLKSILDNAVVENVDAIVKTPKTVEYFITNSVSENKR